MAILCKEQIENRVVRENNATVAKHNALVAKADSLRKQLEELHSDCQDIMDTVVFMRSKGFRIPENLIRGGIYGGYNNLKFDSHRIGWGIDYLFYSDYQHLMFTDGEFRIYCVESFNGHQEWLTLKDINFNRRGDYYISSCCKVMKEFVGQFAEFKGNFMKWISK